MRLAWIKMGGLWPLNTGGRQRTFQLIAELSRRHDVLIVTTHGPDDDPAALAARLDRCEVVSVPYAVPKYGGLGFVRALAKSWLSRYPVGVAKWRVPAVRARVRDELARRAIDLVVADFLFAAPNLPRALPAPLVFFSHNVEFMIWKRLADVERRGWRRPLLEIEWRKTRACETAAIVRADATVAVSNADRDVFAATVPDATIDVIPTGVDVSYFTPAPAREVPQHLVFSGSMDWYPNEDAILYFAEAIWPRLRAALPTLSMTIVGRHPSRRLKDAAQAAGIDVTGTVDDVRPYVSEASVYVVPLRVGGGTRLKIFEAMAMGKAVVSTSIGAEGLALVPDRDLVIADGAERFAAAILDLVADPVRRAALGARARALVAERYSWPAVTREFERALEHARTAAAERPHTARSTARDRHATALPS